MRKCVPDRPPFRAGVLLAKASIEGLLEYGAEIEEDPYGILGGLFQHIDAETARQIIFDLTYQQHGGSGLNITYNDAQRMDLAEIAWYSDTLGSRRRQEAAAIARASKVR